MVKVLADFHHQGLYHSLYMLFEKRLGWELYRQIGPEWHSEGFWEIYNHPATVQQFLGLAQGQEVPTDVHGQPLNEVERKNLHYKIEEGIYYVKDVAHGTTHRAVRLDKFKEMQFDIVLSSVPQHIPRFNKLISKYQSKAKHVFQVGNRWTKLPGVQNIMASTAPFGTNANVVFYHQEFDLDIFKYEPPRFHNVIHSYVHLMQHKGLAQMQTIPGFLPGWTVTPYGAGMAEHLQTPEAVAEAMKRSAFTFHYKPGGDGFGHTIFSSYACGRPALYWGKQYAGCEASRLFEHDVTGIDMDKFGHINRRSALKLMDYAQPERHEKMCEAAHQRFHEVVDFDKEFEEIKKFLERLR